MRSFLTLEGITLRRALTQARATPTATREAVAHRLRVVRQRREAAERLWLRSDRAEALRLLCGAFDIASRDRNGGEPSIEMEAALAARRALGERRWLDEELTPEHDRHFDALMAVVRELERSWWGMATAPAEIARLRALRIAGLALAVIGLLALGLWLAGTPERVIAAASDYYRHDYEYQPSYAFDDDLETEFWLPDGQAGWVEARIDPPVDIARVRVVPGRTDGRSLGVYRVELWDGTEEVAQASGEGRDPTTHPLSARSVDRVRLVVESWTGSGGSVAEIRWE